MSLFYLFAHKKIYQAIKFCLKEAMAHCYGAITFSGAGWGGVRWGGVMLRLQLIIGYAVPSSKLSKT